MSVALTFHPAPHYARILGRVNLLRLRIPLSRLSHWPNENALEVATVPHDFQLVGLHGLSQAFEDRVHLGFEALLDDFTRTPGGVMTLIPEQIECKSRSASGRAMR